jgi:uncharacterized protein (DUF1778 family)
MPRRGDKQSAASDDALKALEQTESIPLSPEDQRAFAEALINPPPLSPAMKRAIERHRQLFGEDIPLGKVKEDR